MATVRRNVLTALSLIGTPMQRIGVYRNAMGIKQVPLYGDTFTSLTCGATPGALRDFTAKTQSSPTTFKAYWVRSISSMLGSL